MTGRARSFKLEARVRVVNFSVAWPAYAELGSRVYRHVNMVVREVAFRYRLVSSVEYHDAMRVTKDVE